MIIALAGRRVDAADAKEARLPLENVEIVRQRVRAMFESEAATVMVSAAACGADLIALSEAAELKMRRRIVLPSDRAHFRETSVIDRPGDWGPVYDKVLDEVEAAGDLIVVPQKPDDEGYAAANVAILDNALAMAKELHRSVKAALIWDGKSRGENDITKAFGTEARQRGLQVVEVSTIK